jgi:protein phosphatase methylesterase 1
VVEGTAIEALPFMNQIITDRPQSFDTLHSGIKWCYNSCTVRKLESARVSFPGQLKEYQKNGHTHYTWRINLKETEKHWMGWFKGLSNIFLSLQIPKILLTAEKERMDKELTIAQMQGRFKVVVIHNVGHSVQEDDYKSTARELYNFLKDFRIPMTMSERAEKELVGIANFHPNLVKY